MAKQLGVSDEALRGLNDLEAFPFPPDDKAALRFADAMTREGGRVDDAAFEALRAYFTEPQMIEIAAVVGLFNYFNRFNNAFRTEITLTDPEVLTARVSAALAERPDDPAAAGGRAARILAEGRRYSSVQIYSRDGEKLALVARHGSGAHGHSEATVPIRRGAEMIGVIEVRSERPDPDPEDSALLERIAGLLAPVLAAHSPGR